MKTVGIIGAGAAGLCALKHSLKKDFSPVVWEHSSTLGGTWIFTPSTGLDEHGFPIHSSMYKSLKTNLPKEIMMFPDFPFEENANSFIKHTEVLKYLNAYADHFSLRPWIKFNHHVDWVEAIEEHNRQTGWRVTVRNLEENTSADVQCDALIICNGHYSVPKYPSIENLEAYLGIQSHSHIYRVPEPFIDKTVVVLGASASGMDISLELSTLARKVYLSHNFPVQIPSDLPENVQQVKGVVGAKSDGFVLADGTSVQADEIIYCTGYDFVFPFLSPSCGIRVKDEQVQPLYKHIINSNFPSMGFIGIPTRILPFPLFDIQAQFLLSTFDESMLIPSAIEMVQHMENNKPSNPKHPHQLESNQWDYMNELSSKAKPLPSFMKTIWDIVWWRRVLLLTLYKQYNYSIVEGSGRVVESLDGKNVRYVLDLPLRGARQLLKLLFLKVIDFINNLWKGVQRVE